MHIKNCTRIIALAALLTAIPFASVRAVEYGGIGGRPAHPVADNPRTESIFVHTIDPGSAVDDGIRVINNTADTKTLIVYAVDSAPSSGGAFACAQAGDPKSDVGSWITLAKHETTLASLTNEVIPFSIALPGSASVGEHNGCIVIEEKKDAGAAPEQSGVILSFRTGIRVAILVPGEINRTLEASGLSVSKNDDGTILFSPKAKNSGNVSIDAKVQVLVKNMLGATVTELGGEYPILRDQTSEWNLEFAKPFWGGWYKGVYTLTYDKGEGAGVGTPSGEPLVVLSGGSVKIWSAPAPIALVIEILILICVVGILALLGVAHRRKAWIKKTWISYSVIEGDNINSLATQHGVSWKLLARVNKLQAPYTLHAGDTVSVPPHVK